MSSLNFRVNCSFFFKIGACRHGERCSRLHNKPTFSQTILLQNLYLNPQNATQTVDKSISKYRKTSVKRRVSNNCQVSNKRQGCQARGIINAGSRLNAKSQINKCLGLLEIESCPNTSHTLLTS